MKIFYFLIFVIFGFLIAKLFSGKYEGDKKERSLIFQIKKNYLHFHHWIYSSFIFVLLIVFGFKNYFLFGFLAGLIAQGLTYKDRFVIWYKKDEYEKIYSKFKKL